MMKKRILFVDDESMILQGLQRLFRTMRTEWDMAFADGGRQALELMDQSPFDVVVSDMRMPGMNGAELLHEVMLRHPNTVRLILSGHADKELILKCVGSTHQYLSKPCEPEMLRATLLRAAATEAALNCDRLKHLVSRMDRLPSIPAVYSEIVEKLQDPETALDEVGKVVAKDIGMTANILKLVNSSFFGLRRQIAEPAEAVAYLGLDTIKALVLSVHAFSQYEGVQIPGFSLPALWQHSMATAARAQAIARAELADNKLRDECLVAGMLHDAGKLVLAANFAPQYTEAVRMARDDNLELMQAEEQVFGAHHGDVGGYLLGLWGLPVPTVEAIALHHNPGRSLNRSFSPLTAVHVANALVHEQPDANDGWVTAPMDADYLDGLGMAQRLEIWRTLKDDEGPPQPV